MCMVLICIHKCLVAHIHKCFEAIRGRSYQRIRAQMHTVTHYKCVCVYVAYKVQSVYQSNFDIRVQLNTLYIHTTVTQCLLVSTIRANITSVYSCTIIYQKKEYACIGTLLICVPFGLWTLNAANLMCVSCVCVHSSRNNE